MTERQHRFTQPHRAWIGTRSEAHYKETKYCERCYQLETEADDQCSGPRHPLSNSRALVLFHNQEQMRSDIEALDEVVSKLKWKRQWLEADLDRVRSSELYKNRPISVRGQGTSVYMSDVTTERSASVWLNVSNKKTWGINIRKYNGPSMTKYLTNKIPTKKEAISIAKDWVAFGELPSHLKTVGY